MPISLGEIYYGDALLQLRDLNAALFEKYGINLHRRLIDLIRTPIEPVKITAIKEPAKNISIKKIVKYRLMAKIFHGNRRKHYEKKLTKYLAKFAWQRIGADEIIGSVVFDCFKISQIHWHSRRSWTDWHRSYDAVCPWSYIWSSSSQGILELEECFFILLTFFMLSCRGVTRCLIDSIRGY